jgi:hypothetical protein
MIPPINAPFTRSGSKINQKRKTSKRTANGDNTHAATPIRALFL